MCEYARVIRTTPADEMASDHCAVLVQMDFVDDLDRNRGICEQEVLLM